MASVADGVEKSLDPRTVAAERIGRGITLGIFAVISLVALLIVMLAGRLGPTANFLLPAVWVVGIALFFAFGMIWPGIRYRYTFYRISSRGILIRRGVVWRSVVTVPRTRIQHTDVSQGPVERMFELASLVIYTAGTQHASVYLGGLSHATALAIRDYLIEGGGDDAV